MSDVLLKLHRQDLPENLQTRRTTNPTFSLQIIHSATILQSCFAAWQGSWRPLEMRAQGIWSYH